MKITKKQLRNLIKEEKQKIFLEAFAATAQEEAEKINAQTGAGYVTDQDFWDRQGIETGEDLAISVLNQTYSDLHKELYNVRPKHSSFTSVEQAQVAISDLDRHYADMIAMEEIEAQQAAEYKRERDELESLMPGEFDYEELPMRSGMKRRVENKDASLTKMLRALIKEALR